MAEIKEYVDQKGKCHFGDWFESLNADVAAKVVTAKARLQSGIGRVEPVGQGVSECKIDYGPGYRVYFGKDGDAIVVLLTGGSKKGQQADINHAKELWAEYKERKRAAAREAAKKAAIGKSGKNGRIKK